MATLADLAAETTHPAEPLECLKLRAWARAYLYSIGELSLHDAVDVLQADAGRDGLLESIGQYEVQKILAAEFGAVR